MITKYEVLKSILEDIDLTESSQNYNKRSFDTQIFYLARIGLIKTCTIIAGGRPHISDEVAFLLKD